MKFTDEEVDTLIDILNDKVSEIYENETFDEYYNRAADLTLAIKQLHFYNEIEDSDAREKVKAIVDSIMEQWIGDAKDCFKRRTEDLSNTAWNNKAQLFSYTKRTCEEAAEYLGILIKFEKQEETDKE